MLFFKKKKHFLKKFSKKNTIFVPRKKNVIFGTKKMLQANSKKWNTMLFEGRNVAYGAFKLRTGSSRRHLLAFVLVLALAATTVAVYLFYCEKMGDAALRSLDAMPSLAGTELEFSLDVQEYVEEHPVAQHPSQEEFDGTGQTATESVVAEENPAPADEALEELIRRTQEEATKIPKDASEMFEEMQPDQIYLVVDVMPEFPGGHSAFSKFLTSAMNYPQDALRRKVQGRVVCEFIVEKDGSISHLKVVKSVDATLDREALRVLRQMPAWKPGERLGEAVRVKFSVPFNFGI